MRLTRSNLHHYLLHHGLVTPQSVTDGKFSVLEVSRRNLDFKVIRKEHPGYFVKQIRHHRAVSIDTVYRESVCCRLASSHRGFESLCFIAPKLLHYDPVAHILITELIDDGESLHERHYRSGSLPAEIGRHLGVALAQCHKYTAKDLGQDAGAFPKMPPAIFSLHETAGWLLRPLSHANIELHALLRDFPDFQRKLDALRACWRIERLIHADIRWDNWVIRPNGAPEVEPLVKLVDWEMADVGDPCWDTGAVFQSFLAFWIDKLPFASGAPPEVLVELTGYPLEAMQPAIREFWRAYVETLPLDGQDAARALDLSARYCGARMIQTALEYISVSSRIPPNALCMLQASLNILNDPGAAIENLLGLPA